MNKFISKAVIFSMLILCMVIFNGCNNTFSLHEDKKDVKDETSNDSYNLKGESDHDKSSIDESSINAADLQQVITLNISEDVTSVHIPIPEEFPYYIAAPKDNVSNEDFEFGKYSPVIKKYNPSFSNYNFAVITDKTKTLEEALQSK